MCKPLSDCRVLVTRPQNQADNITKLITQAGGLVTLFPVIEINPIPYNALNLDTFLNHEHDIAIFLSANAISYCPAKLKKHLIKAKTFLTIGPATMRALLADTGIQASHPAPDYYSSTGLINLDKLKQINGRRIIIISGKNPNSMLTTTLRERGAIVSEVFTYQRSFPKISIPTSQIPEIDISISTSTESLKNLSKLIIKVNAVHAFSTPLLVINKNMHALAPKLGFNGPVVQSQNPTDMAIYNALIKWYSCL